jgi:triacylglycerol lipase
MSNINTRSMLDKSLLFAKLSSIAYLDEKDATREAKKLGFTTVDFYDRDGAQAYRFQNKEDIVVTCRGTQPTQFEDIKADLEALPVIAETMSRVHRGFKKEVDELWPMVSKDIQTKANLEKDLWFCGHSLGAAMATIMASRALHDESLQNPVEIYTYGSPRVGWNGYCDAILVPHNRWRNNNDIVTTVPLLIMGYRHHGTECYINAYGQVRSPTGWQKVKDHFRGMWMGLKAGKIDNFADHFLGDYIAHLQEAVNEEQRSTSESS